MISLFNESRSPAPLRHSSPQGGRSEQTIDFLRSRTDINRPVLLNAPFSAEGVTTVTQTLADGTRIDRTTRSKVYRDSAGRLRREQTIQGLAALDPSRESETFVTIVGSVQADHLRARPLDANGATRATPAATAASAARRR